MELDLLNLGVLSDALHLVLFLSHLLLETGLDQSFEWALLSSNDLPLVPHGIAWLLSAPIILAVLALPGVLSGIKAARLVTAKKNLLQGGIDLAGLMLKTL